MTYGLRLVSKCSRGQSLGPVNLIQLGLQTGNPKKVNNRYVAKQQAKDPAKRLPYGELNDGEKEPADHIQDPDPKHESASEILGRFRPLFKWEFDEHGRNQKDGKANENSDVRPRQGGV